jgi:hypothetical protein
MDIHVSGIGNQVGATASDSLVALTGWRGLSRMGNENSRTLKFTTHGFEQE